MLLLTWLFLLWARSGRPWYGHWNVKGMMSINLMMTGVIFGIAFQHYVFTPEMYDDLAKAYGCGDDDRFGGGKTLVAWRDFCNDFLASRKFDSQGLEVKHAGNDGIAGGGNTSYVYTIPGAQK